MKIHKEDTVIVISGKDKGKMGKVRYAYPKKGRIVVEGVNMIKRHQRPRGRASQAGIIERESAINVSNVMLLCSKCHHPARVGFEFLDDGTKVRVCRCCGEVID